MASIQDISCSTIIAGENDRQFFDRRSLEELAASIAEHGLAQPITVRPVPPGYQIVAGERRFRAIAQVLGRDTIPAIVRELSDEEASAIMLAENIGRADLNPVEEAIAYRTRIDRYGWSYEQLSRVAGVSPELIRRRLSLLSLDDDIQQLVAFGHLPIGHAEAMTKLDVNRQRIALRIFRESNNGMPLARFHPIAGQLLAEQSQDGLFDLEHFWVAQVQASSITPSRGKQAITGAPVRRDLPAVHILPNDTTASIIDRYIAELLQSGHEAEAGAIGTLYTAIVHENYMSVPPRSALLSA
ncbi:MAG TPA: ParB/RepB/Spo0J family partition protein [Anaerolineae bacterium]|nr:ParB/RepB/Spo0J family partition protein [Anaerolineae bacterium]